MKKKLCLIMILSLIPCIFCGCGGEAVPAAQPVQTEEQTVQSEEQTPETEELTDLSEPDAADDSCILTIEGEGPELYDNILPAIEKDYLGKHFRDGRIIDSDIQMSASGGTYIYGWILISGEPLDSPGWRELEYEGQRAYCRYISIRPGEKAGEYSFAKTLAMLPVKKAELPRYGDEERLSGLAGAELYVRELDRSFKISDSESLRKLEEGFTRKSYLDYYNANRLMLSETVNPLFLSFKDGSTALVNTSGDGSCGADLWSGFCGFYSNLSLYELFGVPLDAEGYEKLSDGSTRIHTVLMEPDRKNNYEPVFSTAETDFDPEGRLLRVCRNFTLTSPMEKNYIYDGGGRLIRIESGGAGDEGEKNLQSLSYDEKGRLQIISTYFGDELQDSKKYIYDDADRVTAVIHLNADGSEGLPSGNLHFWYDENDVCHQFSYGQGGKICGEAPPDTGPVRKNKE